MSKKKLGKGEMVIKKLPFKHRVRLIREVELLLIAQMSEGMVRTDHLAQSITYLVAATIVGTRKPQKAKVIEKKIASFAKEENMAGMPGMPHPSALFGTLVTKLKEMKEEAPTPPPPASKKSGGYFCPPGFPGFPGFPKHPNQN